MIVGLFKSAIKQINANDIDSDENVARLIAQAEAISAQADDFVPAVEVTDEALV
jgi:hypothetical protein